MDSWIKLFFTTDSTNLTDGNKVVDGAWRPAPAL
jgi:hypothetical protein